MFTPIETSIGALLLHQASSALLYQNGNILGASGYMHQFLSAPTKETVAFLAGMTASYIPLKALAPQFITTYPPFPVSVQTVLVTLSIGLLVGWGTKVSNGCTSGHMLCGLSRMSGRSAVAVATFFPTALLTHHLVHPSLYTEACPGDTPCYMPVYPSVMDTTLLLSTSAICTLAARTIPNLLQQTIKPQFSTTKSSLEEHFIARQATQFFSGLLFALGLHISQMSHPAKVASFLSFPALSQWDPSLALIILFGVVPNAIEIRRKGFGTPPSFASAFALPGKTLRDVDAKFIMGAAVFGIGWGLTGTCPGPAVLRIFAQPVWGAVWMCGFGIGGKLAK